MIHCRPKTNTYAALILVLLVLIGGLTYTLNHFATQRSFGLAFYLISAVILTFVIIMLMVKMMAGYKFIAAGKDKITTRVPLKGFAKSYELDQVMVWDEDKVISNKREFKQLTIAFDDQLSFTISNHEHVNYDEFVNYLLKKLPQKKVSALQKAKSSKKKKQ
ncbi:hypothetical protein [Cecembia lonarensis]|uniref:Uncharacterized protein n=1 Tax=Cecembia lonarensis (strain CCUG 58316 / KCTC 22772 / LW9) TaxID=1225176 RepID=K1LFI2_CECL9|nr:hypothetical protein [Cecembia lonarensis]EKB49073.1 hypothetical protein B879_02339 [Cecembia lonarensis LW9]